MSHATRQPQEKGPEYYRARARIITSYPLYLPAPYTRESGIENIATRLNNKTGMTLGDGIQLAIASFHAAVYELDKSETEPFRPRAVEIVRALFAEDHAKSSMIMILRAIDAFHFPDEAKGELRPAVIKALTEIHKMSDRQLEALGLGPVPLNYLMLDAAGMFKFTKREVALISSNLTDQLRSN
ncbi:MAG TPA: hypothetical protein VL945_00160 [Candidatus Saccharimonadales bacterium]|nr:hypothetical protein [Candidatus Saccharimonadales bacterium]